MKRFPKPDKTDLNRRRVLLAGAATIVGLGVFGLRGSIFQQAEAAAEHFEISHSDAEWKALLTPEQYAVLREEGTERPFSSSLDHEKRKGIFSCAGCDNDLFSSHTKFDSRTGWPSFYKPLPKGIGERRDSTLGMLRTEIHCRRCGGHLGHVFDDGPPPTGLRYCMNGVAMKFKPAAE
jgi:peptide-methionine (R)-S-oxide reductase